MAIEMCGKRKTKPISTPLFYNFHYVERNAYYSTNFIE